ncbi:MAG: TetR family transcriptional regulator [Rhodoferax sp.]|nr:TetR family transcriptional regulator [Rhodoferax sp.]MCW5640922.1 TetR family transcriptional regulator [Rhodoferax sp.]
MSNRTTTLAQAASASAAPAKGRPRKQAEDLPGSRERILQVATTEFARHGAQGARIERIAADARVNVRMIYHHFGNKDDLFLTVLEEAYRVIRERERDLQLDTLEPREGIRRLVRFSWNYYFAHPEFTALLNSENLQEGRHVARSQQLASLNSPLLDALTRLLERGAREGVFRADADPMQVYVSISALGYFYVSNRYTLSAIFQRDLMSASCLDARLDHITAMVLAYLCERPDTAAHAPPPASAKARRRT